MKVVNAPTATFTWFLTAFDMKHYFMEYSWMWAWPAARFSRVYSRVLPGPAPDFTLCDVA
jgi:hypothetical protein